VGQAQIVRVEEVGKACLPFLGQGMGQRARKVAP
jgi:hypothetical protein